LDGNQNQFTPWHRIRWENPPSKLAAEPKIGARVGSKTETWTPKKIERENLLGLEHASRKLDPAQGIGDRAAKSTAGEEIKSSR
jgi:hypothetical protein